MGEQQVRVGAVGRDSEEGDSVKVAGKSMRNDRTYTMTMCMFSTM